MSKSSKITNSLETLQLRKKQTLSPKLDVVFQALFGELGSERVYVREIHEGNQYGTLNRCIVILICDYSLEEMKKLEKSEAFEGMKKDFENLPYHTEWKIIEKDFRKIVLTDKLELHIISLEKARKMREKDKQDKLLDWLKFIENPKSEEVLEKMEENEVLKEAGEKLDTLSDDIEMQMIADSRWMAIADEHARREAAIIEGRAEGLEKGLEEGRKEGRREGRQEGIVEGEKKAKLETAKKMIEEGISLETVMKITELTKEEIMA